MKRLAAVALLVAALSAAGFLARPRPIEFEASYAAAQERARADGDWIVVHVRRSGRPLGETMDRETLGALAVRRRAHDGFVHLRLDTAGDPGLAARLGVADAGLVTLVLDGDGREIARREGFLDADAFAAFLREMSVRRSERR